MESFLLSIGSVGCLLGVCTKTLRWWDLRGTCKADLRTQGNHRRYKKSRILNMLRNEEHSPVHVNCAVYGRVSSSRQKKSGDLKRQLQSLEQFSVENGYHVKKIYSDVGSGLNDKRKGLLKLLKDAS